MGNELIERRRRIIASSPHRATATGNPATFKATTSLVAPLLTVDVGITQDLNGYDYAWIPGTVTNMIPDTTDTNNGYVYQYQLQSDGSLYSHAGYYTSEYFAVEPDTIYTMSQITGDTNAGAVCFYDSNKEYISGEAFAKRLSFTVTTPSNAAYCRCSQNRRDMKPYITNVIQMEPGETATTIYPYSNICPITSYNTVPIHNRTKNLLPLETMKWTPDVYLGNTGAGAYNTSYKYCANYIPVKPSTTYTLQYYRTTSGANRIHFYNSSKQFITYNNDSAGASTTGVRYTTFTTSNDTYFIRLGTYIKNATNFQLTEGATNPNYSDINKTVNIVVREAERTFWRGPLVINSDGTGTFTREYAGYICDGSDNYDTWSTASSGANKIFRCSGYDGGMAAAYAQGTAVSAANLASSHFRPRSVVTSNDGVGCCVYKSYRNFRPPNVENMTVTDWKQYLQDQYAKGTPLTFCYRVAESARTEKQLTAQQVRTVLGQNSFWSEAGPVTIDYWTH